MSYWGTELNDTAAKVWTNIMENREPDEVHSSLHCTEYIYKFPEQDIVVSDLEGNITLYTIERYKKSLRDPHGLADMRKTVGKLREGEMWREPVVKGIDLIKRERERQVSEEGWTSEHDALNDTDELVDAATAYIEAYSKDSPKPDYWPWKREWYKPTTRIRNLTKAGALIAAEIDRLQDTERNGSEDN